MQSKQRSKNANGVSDEDNALLAAVEEHEGAYEEERSRLAGERENRIRDILEDPSRFFTLEGFGEDETNAAHTALAGREWNEIARMAKRAEIQKLALEKKAKHPEVLVQPGWAWKHKTAFIALRMGNILNTAGPQERLEMVFVHRGHRWEPSYTLAALARRRLKIPSATQSGNIAGDRKNGKAVQLMQRRDYADFLVQNAEGHLRGEAEAQLVMCERCLRELNQGGPGFTDSWSNTIMQDAVLRELADPQLQKDNHSAQIIRHFSAPSPGYDEIYRAVADIHQRTGGRPSSEEVRIALNGVYRMKKSVRDNVSKMHVRINSADLTERAFKNAVANANRTIVDQGKKAPRGAPRKKLHRN